MRSVDPADPGCGRNGGHLVNVSVSSSRSHQHQPAWLEGELSL